MPVPRGGRELQFQLLRHGVQQPLPHLAAIGAAQRPVIPCRQLVLGNNALDLAFPADLIQKTDDQPAFCLLADDHDAVTADGVHNILGKLL